MKKKLLLKYAKFRNSQNSQNSVWDPNFFPRRALPNFFCFTLSLHCWYSIPRLVWFGQLHYPMKKTFFEIPFSQSSKSSVWNTNFFPDKVYQFFFALDSYYTVDNPYRVCFDFDNSLTHWNWIFFKFAKNRTLRNSQNSVWKPKFFPRQAITKTLFAVQSHHTGDTPYRVGFDLNSSPWPDEKDLFLKFLFLRNSKSFVWEPIYFPRQAKPKIFFALHCHYTVDTQYRVWFDLSNSLTRWKKTYF